MTAWPTSRDTRRRPRVSRCVAAALYVLAAGGTATLAASLASLLFPASVSGLVWVAIAMSTVAMAGALTPRRARITTTTREDSRP